MSLGILTPENSLTAEDEALKKIHEKIMQLRREALAAIGDNDRLREVDARIEEVMKERNANTSTHSGLIHGHYRRDFLMRSLACDNRKIHTEWTTYHERPNRSESYRRKTQERITELAANRKDRLNGIHQEDVPFPFDHLFPLDTHDSEEVTIEDNAPQQQPTHVPTEQASSGESYKMDDTHQEATSVAGVSAAAQLALDVESDSENSLFAGDDEAEINNDPNAPTESALENPLATQQTNIQQPEVLPGVEAASQEIADFELDDLPGLENLQKEINVEIGHDAGFFDGFQYTDFGNLDNAPVDFDYTAEEVEADLANFFGNNKTNQGGNDPCLAILQGWEQEQQPVQEQQPTQEQQYIQEQHPIQEQQPDQAPASATTPMDFAAFQRSQNIQQALQNQPASNQASNGVAQPSNFLAGQWTQSNAAPPVGRQIDILSSTRNGYQRRVSNQQVANQANGESTATVQGPSQQQNRQPANALQTVQPTQSSSATPTPSPPKRKRPGRPPKNGPDYARKRKLQGEYGPDEYKKSEGKDRYSPRKKSCTSSGSSSSLAPKAPVHYAPNPQAALGLNTPAEQYIQAQQRRSIQPRSGAPNTTNGGARGRISKKAAQTVPGAGVVEFSNEAAFQNAIQQQQAPAPGMMVNSNNAIQQQPRPMPHFQQQPAPFQPANMQMPQQPQLQAVPTHPMYTAPPPQFHKQQSQQNLRQQAINGLKQLNVVLQQTLDHNSGTLQAYFNNGIPEGDPLVTAVLQQNTVLQNRINENNQKISNPYYQGS